MSVFGDTVISSRLYGLTVVKEDFYLWMGHAEVCYGLRSSCAGHQVQECVVAPGSDVSWAQIAGIHSVDSCVVLGECYRAHSDCKCSWDPQ